MERVSHSRKTARQWKDLESASHNQQRQDGYQQTNRCNRHKYRTIWYINALKRVYFLYNAIGGEIQVLLVLRHSLRCGLFIPLLSDVRFFRSLPNTLSHKHMSRGGCTTVKSPCITLFIHCIVFTGIYFSYSAFIFSWKSRLDPGGTCRVCVE